MDIVYCTAFIILELSILKITVENNPSSAVKKTLIKTVVLNYKVLLDGFFSSD